MERDGSIESATAHGTGGRYACGTSANDGNVLDLAHARPFLRLYVHAAKEEALSPSSVRMFAAPDLVAVGWNPHHDICQERRRHIVCLRAIGT